MAKFSALVLVAASTMLVGASRPHAGHPVHAAAASSASAVSPTSRLWGALLKQCGDTYVYTGSVFDSSGMLNDVQMSHTKLIEYKGARFASVPIRITDAERANGMEARSRVTMRAHLYRVDGGQWQDGPDLRPRNMDDMIGQALGSAMADMFDAGGNGALALELIKFKGQWFVRRSSVDMSGPIIGENNIFYLDKLIAAPRATYDCAAHRVVVPEQKGADASDDQSQ